MQIKIFNKVEHFELIMNRLYVITEYFSSFGIKEFDQQTMELDKKQMVFLTWQVGIRVISILDTPKIIYQNETSYSI